MSRNYSSLHRRNSDDEFHYQGCDLLNPVSNMRKKRKSSSSSSDYPIRRRPMEEETTSRYYSPDRNYSKRRRRRRYATPPIRYPSTPSPERRRRYDLHASRLSQERKRRYATPPIRYPSTPSPERRRRYDLHASRLSPERRRRYYTPPIRYPSTPSPERRRRCDLYASRLSPDIREYVSSEYKDHSHFNSIVETRDEEIFSYISSNFCFGTSMKTGMCSNRLDIGSSLDDLVSFPVFVSDDIVVEILSRLPVKSLLRFKSVCKHWLSLIKHDRHFADLHCLNSSPNLICITGINPRQQQVYTQNHESDDDQQQVYYEDEIDGYKFPQQILCAEIVKGTIMNKVVMTDDKWFDYEYLLGLVNGLACFLNWNEDEIRLYNVSTREASPWIKSTLLSEERDKSEKKFASILRKVTYRFGFDPERKEHKVFCFCRLSDSANPSRIAECPDYTSCEVLAVGRDTKWRRINVVPNENNKIKINKVFPSYDVQRRSVYANGTIYWRNRNRNLDVGSNDPDVIVALDVGSEKFRVIPIPKFVLDEDHVYNRHSALFMLRGRVAVVNLLSDNIVKLWMLDDGAEDKKLENCRGSCERNWIAETIALPYSHHPRYVEFHGVADQLLLSVYSEDQSLYRKFSFLHFYDCIKKTFQKIEIDGLSSVPFFDGTSIITTFTGSLYPVKPQQDKSQHFVVA